MEPKTLFTWSSFIASLLIIVFFTMIISSPTLIFPAQASSYMRPISSLFSSGQLSGKILKKPIPWIPIRIKIPTIKVDAFLERVGLTVNGSVDVPKGGVNAAWYELGPRPGKIGNAVIVWHYGTWKTGQWSVFDNLKKLHTGDKIFIEDTKGNSITFVVTHMKSYDPTAIVPEIFTSTDGKSHLNIITCGWVWNKITKHFPDRLVVFTDRL